LLRGKRTAREKFALKARLVTDCDCCGLLCGKRRSWQARKMDAVKLFLYDSAKPRTTWKEVAGSMESLWRLGIVRHIIQLRWKKIVERGGICWKIGRTRRRT